ncbi:MAG: hypothetical protein CO167_03475, partial [Candidatus Marinimicrobia bacterium CG_4_9_14_3_um_filter_48_9]
LTYFALEAAKFLK